MIKLKKPLVPDGWTIEEHQEMKSFDPKDMELYLDEKQKTGYIDGNELREKLKDKPVLNASALDYLLEHQKLIPEEWKDKLVSFFGTIYRSSYGYLYVRCLYWHGEQRRWDYYWLDSHFYDSDPAALLRKSSAKTPLKLSSNLDTLSLELPNAFEHKRIKTMEEVRKYIKNCEGKHVQQVVYSTYHDGLTQICFGCKKIRTTIIIKNEKE